MFPVLVGAPGATDLVLSSPIILYDYPAIAPESQGDLYDATEIDEILALRVLTLTDDGEGRRRARPTPAPPRSSTAATTWSPTRGSACMARSVRSSRMGLASPYGEPGAPEAAGA